MTACDPSGAPLMFVSMAALLAASPVAAQDIDFDLSGFVDARVVDTSGDRTTFQGGLGKLQWNGNGGNFRAVPEFDQALVAAAVGITPELRGFADARWDPNLRTQLDLLDAYLRWRPVSTGNWRWSVKAGAFFPPVSLENEGIGWTSPWSLTPSAIDSWVGDELRTLGGEAMLEWRDGIDDVQVAGAVFGWNDPAGVQLAQRGWVFDDQPAGLFSDYRLTGSGASPAYAEIFHEIDNGPGWYGNVSWSHEGLGRVQVMRYDNEADASVENNGQYAWRTGFWSLGAATEFGAVTLMAQGMIGQTAVAANTWNSTTDFHAAYVLLGWERDDWRVAIRLDQFGTRARQPIDLSEHGWAPLTALTFEPLDWLRLTGEALVVESWRTERLLEGLPPRALETQLQFGARVFF